MSRGRQLQLLAICLSLLVAYAIAAPQDATKHANIERLSLDELDQQLQVRE